MPEAQRTLVLSPDPLLGWTHSRDIAFFYTHPNYWERDFATTVRYNAMGLRGADTVIDTSGPQNRILWIGDSFGEAMAIDEEKMASALLERMLNQGTVDDASGWRVINEAVSNYGLSQMEIGYRARWAEIWRPNLVIALVSPQIMMRSTNPSFGGHGIQSLRIRPTYALESGQLVARPSVDHETHLILFAQQQAQAGALVKPARHNSHLIEDAALSWWMRLVARSHLFSIFLTRRSSFRQMLGLTKVEEERAMPLDDDVMEISMMILDRLHQEAESRGARCILFETMNHPRWRLWRNAFLSEAAARGLEVIPLGDTLAAECAAGRSVTLSFDGHWNEHGNTVVAQAIYDWLIQKEPADVGVGAGMQAKR